MNPRIQRMGVGLAATALLGVGAMTGSWRSATALADTQQTAEVAARDNYFSPNSMTVPVGTTVRWTNQGLHGHTATSYTGAFESGTMSSGMQYSYTFAAPGTYRYYCRFHVNVGMSGVVYVTGSGGGGGGGGGGVNLALNRPAQASSSQAGHTPNMAVDGNPGTFWASAGAAGGPYLNGAAADLPVPIAGVESVDPSVDAVTDTSVIGDEALEPSSNRIVIHGDDEAAAPDSHNPQWIYVDLGQTMAVSRLHMAWNPGRHARGYSVYASCGGNWCRIGTTNSGDGDDTLALTRAVNARYFLLSLTYPAIASGPYELREWEIFGGGGGSGYPTPPPTTTMDVAAHKPAQASSEQIGFEAGRVTDRNLDTEWRSAGKPAWVMVDFGAIYNVDRAVLRWPTGTFATSYALYAWNGSGWYAVYANNAGNGGDDTAMFPARNSRYLLMYAASGPSAIVGLKEFEVYGRATGGGYPLSQEWMADPEVGLDQAPIGVPDAAAEGSALDGGVGLEGVAAPDDVAGLEGIGVPEGLPTMDGEANRR